MSASPAPRLRLRWDGGSGGVWVCPRLTGGRAAPGPADRTTATTTTTTRRTGHHHHPPSHSPPSPPASPPPSATVSGSSVRCRSARSCGADQTTPALPASWAAALPHFTFKVACLAFTSPCYYRYRTPELPFPAATGGSTSGGCVSTPLAPTLRAAPHVPFWHVASGPSRPSAGRVFVSLPPTSMIHRDHARSPSCLPVLLATDGTVTPRPLCLHATTHATRTHARAHGGICQPRAAGSSPGRPRSSCLLRASPGHLTSPHTSRLSLSRPRSHASPATTAPATPSAPARDPCRPELLLWLEVKMGVRAPE